VLISAFAQLRDCAVVAVWLTASLKRRLGELGRQLEKRKERWAPLKEAEVRFIKQTVACFSTTPCELSTLLPLQVP